MEIQCNPLQGHSRFLSALQPYVGDWSYLIRLTLCVLVVRRMLWLTARRSFFVAVVYFGSLAAVYIAIGLTWGSRPRQQLPLD